NHVPRMPHERFHGTSELGFRGDAIVQLDWCVGELVKHLRDNDLAENTMIVFCSDNGPVGDDGYADGALEKNGDHKAAGPFTGGKYSIYEGGTRTPFITWWPGTVKPAVSDEVVCTIDMANSFVNYVGGSLPEEAFTDSIDVMTALMGGGKGRESLVQQDNGRSNNNKRNLSYRKGKWKLLRHDRGSARNLVVNELLANTEVPQFQLIDLEKDPAEKNNVIADHPELAEKMKAELEQIIQSGRSR
ncbi:MAG: sulfatase-like hydrolase/transferase, partial [Verrucomicrobiota bacterium]